MINVNYSYDSYHHNNNHLITLFIISELIDERCPHIVTHQQLSQTTESDTFLVRINNSERPINCSFTALLRLLSRVAESLNHTLPLYGTDSFERTQIDHRIRDFSCGDLSLNHIETLNAILEKKYSSVNTGESKERYIIGNHLSLADVCLWRQLKDQTFEKFESLQKWYHSINEYLTPLLSKFTKLSQLNPKKMTGKGKDKKEVNKSQQKEQKSVNSSAFKNEGKYVDLPDAVEGSVVVRFPPEASGYLHIGHAKAALLNQHYAQAFKGKLIFRFDDTNPEKEKENFEKEILKDAEMLHLKPDTFTRTSDHFDLMLSLCEKMIREGKAYADDTPGELMKQEREQRIESKNRNNSVEKNLTQWDEMKKGTVNGLKWCIRAKVDMSSDNGCMRDPTIYRCKTEPHSNTGDRYKAYPTYDFACPIVDAIEGVTHTLRTSEYLDRDVQYFWFIEALGLRKPHICAYSRLNMMNTVLSKRKLTWFVNEGIVEGWDDPRMPTVRGIIRRGMTVEGLKQFIIAQGSSRSVVFMEWDKIWAFNKKVIDPIAPRFNAVERNDHVMVNISGDTIDGTLEVSLHPKNADIGKRNVKIGNKILIDRTDAEMIKENENVTFINWGNLMINKVNRDPKSGLVMSIDAQLNLDNKDFKKTLKVTWIEMTAHIDAVFVYYDHIVVKPLLAKDDDFKDFMNKDTKFEIEMLTDDALKNLKNGDIIQIQRKGFFICDSPYDESTRRFTGKASPIRLISIPDGSTDMNVFPKTVQVWKKKNMDATAKLTVSGGKKDEGKTDVTKLDKDIKECGDNIRQLKANKAAKDVINESVQKLLSLKGEFKKVTGKEWTPDFGSKETKVLKEQNNCGDDTEKINEQIKAQGERVRQLKTDKATKDAIQKEVEILLSLKKQYQEKTGKEWKPETGNQNDDVKRQKKDNKSDSQTKKGDAKAKPQKKSPEKEIKGDDSKREIKKQTRLGIETKKSENTPEWYTEVITKSEMIEYYDVSGCYILRPWSFSIWEVIQSFFDAKIKALGVQNCYFPMFISKSALETEKTHIADFAPEVAWVTRSGQSELAEPIAIRPTSETVMYPSYAKWVQSHRDLPLKLNQWCSVVRWEFKTPTPFLRTREFLWQEGHSAFATQEEALEEVYTILDYYGQIYEDLLAIPVVKGRKTEKEKFAGGDVTTTVEAYVGTNGRGIQGGTSHHLGQNFSKMFEITFEDPIEVGKKRFAYQNSWGLSTRTIGAIVMIHGDDKGLVLPPRVAAVQIIIVPCGITANTTDEDKNKLLDACKSLEKKLIDGGIKCRSDLSDHYSPGWKFNHWELKGVPIRVELGPKDLQKNEYITVRRDNGVKQNHQLTSAVNDCKVILDDIHNELFNRAKQQRDSHMIVTQSWNEFIEKLDQKFIILSPFCGEIPCEDRIKKDSAKEDVSDASGPLMGAKSLCIPLEQPQPITDDMKCIYPQCNAKPKFFTLFGRSY